MSTYYPINEESARTAHMMVHMSDYVQGSCTASYKAAVDKAAALVEAQKKRVSPFYHDKLDGLLEAYSRRLAQWQNDFNRNQAAYPSQFIAGASGYNMRKHEKQMSREDTLWKEYDEIKSLLDKIKSVGTGAVNLADPYAREILTGQIQQQEQLLESCKAANAYYKKNRTIDGCPGISPKELEWLTRHGVFNAGVNGTPLELYGCPFPAYELSSIRSKIKRLQARLAELDKLEAAAQAPAEPIYFDGGEIIQNAEINRLQIVFDEMPDPDTRTTLKSHGFRWSPSNKAWHRQLTGNALHDAKSILEIE